MLLKRIRNERSIEDKENVEINKLDKRADGERMRVEAVKRKEIDGLAVPEEGNILEYRIHL